MKLPDDLKDWLGNYRSRHFGFPGDDRLTATVNTSRVHELLRTNLDLETARKAQDLLRRIYNDNRKGTINIGVHLNDHKAVLSYHNGQAINTHKLPRSQLRITDDTIYHRLDTNV